MKFVVKCDKDKQTLINYLKELENDYLVNVKKQRNTRSNMQNNYYWSCIVQTLSNELGYFPDEIHDILKVKFASEWNSIEINDRNVGIQVVKSTARMNTKAFEIYVDQIRIWAITELGIRLMLPNEFK
tara:strand:- start:614 stop:997 length:384 start_codon:yes stop_codon:yes gene_type:complete